MDKKILILVLIIVVAAATGYIFFRNRIVEKSTHDTVIKERDALLQKAEELEDKITLLEKEIQADRPTVDSEKLVEAFGEAAVEANMEKVEAEQAGTKIMNFFNYLDQKGYLNTHGIDIDAATFFMQLIDRLKHSTPVVSGETKDLYTLLKNITYFFRVFGKSNLLVIKNILESEYDIIEPTSQLFFDWIDPWNPIEDPDRITVQPEILYEYASFFLHTIAGQSYLNRRDSKTRCLASYYCILILDQANIHDLNKYGIDIRPHIDALINEMQSHQNLTNRIDYINKLNGIRKKY